MVNVKTDFGKSLETCRDKIKKPKKSSYGEDVSLIMRSMKIQTCKTKSAQACVTAQGLFGTVGTKACAGYEQSQGCEQIMANFNKTRIVKEALSCAIKNRMQDSTTRVSQVNSINIDGNGATCCMCEMKPEGCSRLDDNGKLVGYKCTAVGNITQSNTADIKTLSKFTIDESEDVKNTILSAVKEDVTLAADTQKKGLGADTGQKVISGSEIESITSKDDLKLTNSIQKSLNQLSQVNEFNLKLSNSGGPCIEEVNQANIIKLVVENIMSDTLKSIKEDMDSSSYSRVIDAVASKKVVGLDVGKDPPMGGIGSMITVVIIVGICGFIYYKVKNGDGDGDSPGQTFVKITTGNDPKATGLALSFAVMMFLFILTWIILIIRAMFRSLKSGFGLF